MWASTTRNQNFGERLLVEPPRHKEHQVSPRKPKQIIKTLVSLGVLGVLVVKPLAGTSN
jgi:hypothetical protein